MSRPLNVALLWHLHQPSYADPSTGQLTLPWVRLHTTRAYFDMAWLLERHPAVRATFNFVPVLVRQIQSYLSGGRDHYFELSRKPARLLTTAERAFMLRHFFSIDAHTCIRPRARYWRLYERAREPHRGVADFSDDDLRDLQVLFNLAWFGFAARIEYPLLAELEAKGRGFEEDEKRKLLDLQIAMLRRVLPLYQRLADRGQIELSTTPYYHPILPLVVDSDAARRCQPKAPLPPRFSWPEDARLHIDRAAEAHQMAFGAPPSGVWPAEGAVSPEAVELFAAAGLRWTATDEAQLWKTVGDGKLDRTWLYRPFRYDRGRGAINIVFRDRTLSDLIGFTYARNPAPAAVADLVGRLVSIAAQTAKNEEPPLVVIALDGENPWEYYAESGRPFLDALYATLAARADLQTVCLGAHLAANPPKRTLTDLHSGSWINGDYGVWIGSAVENQAWKLLGEARAFFAEKAGETPAEALAAAREHLLQAEGSDWFWWYGDHFASQNDEDFDYLFRSHLRRVYALLGGTPPAALDRSLYPNRLPRDDQPPKNLISPRFDTPQSTYFDWNGAGVVDLINPGGSMYQAAAWFRRLRYGFDRERFYLRFEPLADEAPPDLSGLTLEVRVRGPVERIVRLPLDTPGAGEVVGVDGEVLARVVGGFIELGVRFTDLGLGERQQATASAHLMRGPMEIDRFPGHHELLVTVPDDAFEAERWTV
ncbi:MAG: glycoside hydrolase [Myxococcales bacterium]|nr:glycoside hydrolase [Myxococcales bacterium]